MSARPARRLAGRARAVMAPLSPRGWRWRRFLRGLPLDPGTLTGPLEPPSADDFIICGAPRTGTTLLCAALFQPPAVVTVMEPWDGMRFPPAPLFRSLRDEIDRTGSLGRGRLDIASLVATGEARWVEEGRSRPEVSTGDDGYVLGVKWPGYWRYLDRLPATKFVVCVRHPEEVVASFKANGGRVALGLQYETRFNATLNRELAAATNDVGLRRVLLYDYVNERLLPYLDRPNVFVVRYERWFEDPAALLEAVGGFLGRDVSRPPVRVRRTSTVSTLPDRDRELVRTRCRTAAALGYRLDH